MAKRIYDDHGEDFGVEISRNKDTVLHIAAGAKRIDFAKELVKKMNEKDLEKTNENGRTALFTAAASGTVEIAKVMIKMNKNLAMVPDKFGTLPIQMAAALGHKDMVRYLYKETKNFLKEEDRKELFVTAIEIDLFDVALQMFMECSDLAIARARARAEEGGIGITALHALAQKDLGAKQARELVKLIWERVILLSHTEISELIAKPRKLIFDAAERGNSMFLSILIHEYPDLIWKIDNRKNNYNIFHYAVKYRQEDVFNLTDEIGSSTEIFGTKDEDNNNILHLAAMLAPLDRLNIEPGPAIQMQRELMWFQKVKNVVEPRYAEARNNDGFTPRALFTEMHKDLRDKAEKWMNKTAGSCMVVAALIATVAFAAAITVPGGNNQDTGFPIFHEQLSFIIFALSDATSLIFSSASIAIFLFIPTSSYAEEDFLWLLPLKLNYGVATLFTSMAAMMIVFSSTFFILVKETRLWIAILVNVYVSTPVLLFLIAYKDLIRQFASYLFSFSKVKLVFWPSKSAIQ